LKFENSEVHIQDIQSKKSGVATFTFSIDKSAPVNMPNDVTFTVASTDGQQWTKTLSLQVSPPDHFELFQNYPNPFNPSTTIGYQLPITGNVILTIYDITGREVSTLFNGMIEAGYHGYKWNASAYASGMYIYQLALTNVDGRKELYRKKLLFLK
jgi:hypothetical protein